MPQGDFSAIAHLPAMYHHCQSTEDPDMNLADFITDHLLNLDEFFSDTKETDEHELPHNPLPFHTTSAPDFFCVHVAQIILLPAEKQVIQSQGDYNSPYFPRINQQKVFQPPRA